jgi:hypothetical protein
VSAGFTPLFAATATLYTLAIVMTYVMFRRVGELSETGGTAAQANVA